MTNAQTQDAEIWTTLKILRWTQKFFANKSIPQPRLDAEVLLGHVLKFNRVQLYTHFDQPLSPEELTTFRSAIKRRVKHEPVAYIVGSKEFWSMPFKVDQRVLIPRPDTELLVERARLRARQFVHDPKVVPKEAPSHEVLSTQEAHQAHLEALDQLAQEHAAHDPFGQNNTSTEPSQPTQTTTPTTPTPFQPSTSVQILDVGTGSGAIAISLASELPYAEITATDISQEALDLAQENAETLLDHNTITFLQGDYLQPVSSNKERFALIISNPPYIPKKDIPTLMADVADHEPHLALTPGESGLEAYISLIQDAWDLLSPGGYLLFEMGHDQAETLRSLFDQSTHPWADIHVIRDPFSKHQRVIEAHKPR